MDYEPTELVVTARTGTRLADLETELYTHGQMLAFEPPHFGSGATLGGCIAAGHLARVAPPPVPFGILYWEFACSTAREMI